MSEVLGLAGVSVIRGTKTLLDNIDWRVVEGERWVVLGPNGAGKSTLLQIAAARMHPTRGVAGILDEVLGAVDVFELRPRIGVASASLAHQIPENEKVLNVVVTASYGVTGRWREAYDRDDERRAFSLLEEWGVSTFFNRSFGSLSDGERKRVQIARALMTDPELLLLDEPTVGLDPVLRADLWTKFAAMAAAGTTLVISSHVMEEAGHCDSLLLLREGRLLAQLTPAQLRQRGDTPDLELAFLRLILADQELQSPGVREEAS